MMYIFTQSPRNDESRDEVVTVPRINIPQTYSSDILPMDDIEESSQINFEDIIIDTDVESNDSICIHPDAFYCPKTKEIFRDPVVVRTGFSYERSAVDKTYNSSLLYSNRALKEIIEERERHSGTNHMGSLRRLQCSVRSSFDNLLNRLEISSFQSKSNRQLPNAYYCPITLEIMKDPVIDKDGTTYERSSIVKWIKTKGKSPTTRRKASIKDLYPNNAIYDLIRSELEKSDESVHPSIRRWKEQKEEDNTVSTMNYNNDYGRIERSPNTSDIPLQIPIEDVSPIKKILFAILGQLLGLYLGFKLGSLIWG